MPLVGFMGRLEYEKGPDLFLKAAEHIHHQMPEVHFVMVGDGSMKEQLHLLCTRMRLDQQMHFVDWKTDNVNLYPALDILAHTSRSDGTSLVLMEALQQQAIRDSLNLKPVNNLKRINKEPLVRGIITKSSWHKEL